MGVKIAANGECVLASVGCSELSALVGVGEVVMLDIMAERDDNGWQAGVTPAPSDFSCSAPRSFVALSHASAPWSRCSSRHTEERSWILAAEPKEPKPR